MGLEMDTIVMLEKENRELQCYIQELKYRIRQLESGKYPCDTECCEEINVASHTYELEDRNRELISVIRYLEGKLYGGRGAL